jgi:hypothetical protein
MNKFKDLVVRLRVKAWSYQDYAYSKVRRPGHKNCVVRFDTCLIVSVIGAYTHGMLLQITSGAAVWRLCTIAPFCGSCTIINSPDISGIC